MTLRSMTGQGRAEAMTSLGLLRVELRSVNNRGFKCVVRAADEFSSFGSEIEQLIRADVTRGSVNAEVRLDQVSGSESSQVNVEQLSAHLQRCYQAIQMAGLEGIAGIGVDVGLLLSMPGVIRSSAIGDGVVREAWSEVAGVVRQAVADLVAMRRREGEHMSATLISECGGIEDHIRSIESHAPNAAEQYRQRLEAKVKRLLSDFEVQFEAVDLLRETQVYADRVDVTEELTRLQSHLSQFRSVVGVQADAAETQEPTGRKLDFIIQEMFREANTIGSKTPLASVSESIVEIKCAIERMRELVQNLE